MAFDPDAYLAQVKSQSSDSFNPDDYLAQVKQTPPKTQGLFGTSVGKNSDFLKKARIPSQVVKAVSDKMMDMYEPQTQSVALNAALRIPETLASNAVSNVASQVSPESGILHGAFGLLKVAAPAVNAVGRWIGNGAEKLSGLSYDTPGVLGRTVENPSLPFRPGVETANETYGQLVDKGQIRPEIATNLDKKDLVQKAFEAAKDETITPDEAFVARKTMGQIKNTIPQDTFYALRQIFDDIAKTKFAGADAARTIAEDADNLRNLAPLNKNGTTSIFKTGIGLAGMGASHFSPAAILTAPAFSPAIQAGLASGLGVAKQAISPALGNPASVPPVVAGLSQFFKRKNQ